jgi:general secretion pathway protein A
MCENGRAVTSDDRTRRSLADDPNFIDSLTDLDHGVIEQDQEVARPLRPAPRTSQFAHDDSTDVPVVPLYPRREEDPQRPRRFLDLFPSGGDINTALAASAPVTRAPEADPPRMESRFRERRSPDRAKPSGYEQFYGLDEPPFSLAADPRFLYHSQSHDRAAQAVLDAIRNREGIVLLTGALGLGKTLLCRSVLEELDRRTLTSYVTEPSSPQELLKTILVDFGVISHADRSTGKLAHASVPDLQAALRDFLYTLAPLHAFAVVMLDDAHGLSLELLRHIGVLAESGGGERLLQVMLVGQPPLVNTLTKTSLRPIFQQAATRATLAPLEAEEVEEYVRHRLNVGGRNARVEFNRAAIAELQALSRGVPRVINLICDRALLEGSRQSASEIDAQLVRRAAEHLDLVPRQPGAVASASRFVGLMLFFALLMIVGAAAGAFFYRSEIAALIQRWQERPAAPAPPSPEKPEPLTPIPPGVARD